MILNSSIESTVGVEARGISRAHQHRRGGTDHRDVGQWRRVGAQEEPPRRHDALEATDEGFVLFDADDRIVMCNSRYRSFFLDVADQVESRDYQGATLRLSWPLGGWLADYTAKERRIDAGLKAAGFVCGIAGVRKSLEEHMRGEAFTHEEVVAGSDVVFLCLLARVAFDRVAQIPADATVELA